MASATEASSALTPSFIAISFELSIPNCALTNTFTFPMYTPDNKQVCDLALLGTVSVPCNFVSQSLSFKLSSDSQPQTIVYTKKLTNLTRLHAKKIDDSLYSFSQTLSLAKPIFVDVLIFFIHAFPCIPEIGDAHLYHVICSYNLKILQLVLIFYPIILCFTCAWVNLLQKHL